MNTPDELRAEMVAGLVERGELSPGWRPAFDKVPRHGFIPDTVYRYDETVDGPDMVPLHRADEPGAWLEIAYANSAVKTQVDDGQPDEGGRGRELSSSASQPAVMAEMLTALDVEPGMRVLEIGTGTGYNAALLAHRLGAENVTSIEVDPALAEHARRRLAAEGYGKVTVITGDGAEGWVDGAPYDRVLATAAAREVPYPWIGQLRSGGSALVPWGSAWYPASLLRLTAETDGTGSGRIIGSANFMALRAQRRPRWGVSDLLGCGNDISVSTTDLHPWHVAGQPAAATAIGFRVPSCQQYYSDTGNRPGRLNLADLDSRSWARLSLADEPPYQVEQAGPRRLFDEVANAHRWWLDSGRPGIDQWLVTVTPAGQRIELNPDGAATPLTARL